VEPNKTNGRDDINGTAERERVSHIRLYLLHIRSSVPLISSLPSGDVNVN